MQTLIQSLLVIGSFAVGCKSSTGQPSENSPQRSTSSKASKSSTPVLNPSKTAGSSKTTHTPAGKAGHRPTKAKRSVRTRRTIDEMLLFFPAKYPVGNWNPAGLEFEDARFVASDGTRLHGWYCPCKEARGYLLFAHGNAGNLTHRVDRLIHFQQKLRMSVLIFDYRGFGRSEGVPTVPGVLQDVRAALAFLAKRAGVKESEIVVLGRSLGGAIAVQLAAESQPRALVLESTFSSLKDAAAHRYPALAWIVPRNKLNSAAEIKRYKGPLLYSHGDADDVVPYALGLKLFQAANEPKELHTIANGGHNGAANDAYSKQLDKFLR